jgi:hypothetical protein
MKRLELFSLLSGAVAWPVAVRAQQGERLRHRPPTRYSLKDSS